MEKPNCLKCKYFHNTYDPQAPRGCKLFNFKTLQFPSWLVKKETGKDCQAYEAREHFSQNKSQNIDFNDKKYW